MAEEGGVKPFLRQVAAYLVHRSSDPLEEMVLVLPSRRACRFIQRYIGIEAGAWTWSPRVLTMDEFIHRSHPLTPADPIATYFELYDVYSSVLGSDASSFGSFLKWGRTLLQDLDEVDRYLIPPKELFSDLRKIKEIEDWSFDREELSFYQERYMSLWTKLGSIHEGLKESLSSKGRVLQGEAYRKLGSEPETAEAWLEAGTVHFIGLNALSRAEERTISHLVKTGKAELHFDSDPYYMEDAAQEAGHFLRNYRKNELWRNGFAYRSGPMGGGDRKIQVIGMNGRVAQAKLAGRILEREAPSGDDLHSAIVLADEGLLQPVLHSLPSSVGPLNVTMGYPLERSPLHAFFRDLLRMHRRSQRSRQEGYGAVLYHRDLLRVLEHPFMDLLFQGWTGSSSRLLVDRIRSGNRAFLDPESLERDILALNSGLSEVPEGIRRLFRIPDQLPEAAISIQEAAMDVFRPIVLERGDAMDRESFREYERVLRRMRDLFSQGHRLSDLEAYERVLGQIVEGRSLSFTGEPLQGVQIMGMLETRALDLNHIVLLSANETLLPKSASEASLIPQDLRAYYKMPTRHEKDAVYAYHFHRMIQRADRVDLIYDSDPDGAGSGEKSRFLTQLLHEAPSKDPRNRISQHSVHVPLRPERREALSIPKDERVQERLEAWAGSGISPTALSTYVEDPYLFYRKYVLGLPEPEELAESIDALALGDVIHQVLHELYLPFEGKVLPAGEFDGLTEKVPPLVRERFRDHYEEKDIDSGKNHIMLRIVQERIQQFLRMEREQVEAAEARGDDLFIESLERPFRTDLSIEVKGRNVPVRLKGTADRIDRIGGRTRLIDLKTGQVDPSKLSVGDPAEVFEEPERKYVLQLLFYGLVHVRGNGADPETVDPAIIGFRALNKGSMKLKPRKDAPHSSMGERLDAFEEALSEKLREILDPDRPILERSDGGEG